MGIRGSTSTASGSSNTSSLSMSLADCGAQAGDEAIVIGNIGAGASITMTGPSGWTQEVYQVMSGSATFQLGVYRKVLDATDISNDTVTVTSSASRQMSAALIVGQDVQFDVISAVSFDSSSPDAASVPIPPVTPDADDALLIAVVSTSVDLAATDITLSPSTGWTQQEFSETASTSKRCGSAILVNQLTGGGGSASATGSIGVTTNVYYASATIAMTPTATPTAPIADAGPDQPNIKPFNTFTLDFSGSNDPDGGSLTAYTPTQIAGPTVALDDTDPVHPTGVAPATPSGTTLIYSLVVTDDEDTDSTNTAEVSLTVLPHSMFLIDSPDPSPLRGVLL